MRLLTHHVLFFFLLFFATANIAKAQTPISGPYIMAFGGVSYAPKNVNLMGTFTNPVYRAGFDAGGELGIKGGPFRYALQGLYNENKPKRFDFSGVRQSQVSGKTKATVFLLDIFYDFENLSPVLAPFVGVGIGVSHLSVRLDSGTLVGDPFSRRKNIFSYSGQCGVNYNFAEDFSVALAYQYLRTNHIDRFNDPYQAHMANFSVTYRFDN